MEGRNNPKILLYLPAFVQNLQHLLSISPANQKTHETILHSLFAVSLEDMTHALPSLSAAHSSAHSAVAIASTSPFQQDLDSQLHMMRATNHNVSNRMFDKPMTLIVDPSGRAGGSGEHSPCDALVPSIAVERALADGIDASCFDSVEPEPFPSWSSHQPEMHMVGWERLEWEVDDKIRSECEAARKRAKLIIDDSDNTVFWFEHYGTAWIKNVGRLPFAVLFRTESTRGQLSIPRTLTFKWRCSLHTTKPPANSPRPTRLR